MVTIRALDQMIVADMKRLTKFGWLDYQAGDWEERHPWFGVVSCIALVLFFLALWFITPP